MQKIRLITLFTTLLIIIISCQQNATIKNKVIETKNNDFEKVVFDILDAFNKKDETKINHLINNNYKVAVLYRRGTFDNIEIVDSIKISTPIPEYLPYDYQHSLSDNEIKYEELPEYSCDTEQWNKPTGIYCDTITVDTSRSRIATNEKKYDLKDWKDSELSNIKINEKISRKIIVIGKTGETFIFFVTKDKDHWYLSGIDRFEACSA